jgi:nicotinate-nucleotide adenylyltransferase
LATVRCGARNIPLQPIGIFGGTFDPIHFGHLRMAQELGESMGLVQVRFIPAARPPHRSEPHSTSAQRAQMVRLAIAGNALFTLDTLELERSGPSYTFDTLTALRAEVGAITPLYLLLGADAFLGLSTWYRWRELFNLAHIVVAHRPGFVLDADNPGMSPELREEWRQRYVVKPQTIPDGAILTREITALDISASAIRSLITSDNSARYLLPEAVLAYILQHKLYTATDKEPDEY